MYRCGTALGPLLLLSSCFLSINGRGKYSIENNLPVEPQNIPSTFRMNKINVVWEKAQTMLKPNQLDELFKALKLQDEKEIEYKHSKVNGREDEEGELKADLLNHFNEIIAKFGLHDKLVAILKPEAHKSHEKNLNQVTDDDKSSSSSKKKSKSLPPPPPPSASFKDPKVEKLWKTAAEAGFSTLELSELETELKHHEDKQDELVRLLNDMDDGLSTNEIPQARMPGESKLSPEKTLKLKKTKVKEIKETLSGEFDRLKNKVQSSNEGGFADPKVQAFWRRAQKANFTETELVSLKEELQHFQRKIEKHEWISNRIDDAEADVKEGKSFDASTHGELRERQKDFNRKIKKMMSHFEDYIGTRDLSDL